MILKVSTFLYAILYLTAFNSILQPSYELTLKQDYISLNGSVVLALVYFLCCSPCCCQNNLSKSLISLCQDPSPILQMFTFYSVFLLIAKCTFWSMLDKDSPLRIHLKDSPFFQYTICPYSIHAELLVICQTCHILRTSVPLLEYFILAY